MSHTKEDLFSLPRDPLITAPQSTVNKDGLPKIIITKQFMRDITGKAIKAIELSNRSEPYIFRHGSNIIRLNNDQLRLESLNTSSTRGILDRCANFYTEDKKNDLVPA